MFFFTDCVPNFFLARGIILKYTMLNHQMRNNLKNNDWQNATLRDNLKIF